MQKNNEKQLVKGCKRYNRQVQKEVYETYAPLLRAVCSRYARDYSETEDILQEGFVKIFSNIKKFEWQGEGSFIKWMKRVAANAAITYYHKHAKLRNELSIEDSPVEDEKNELLADSDNDSDIIESATGISKEDIIQILQNVPEDFRIVFNLNILEGYSHKEIGEMLNIKTETSRTRLMRAKTFIKKAIQDKQQI